MILNKGGVCARLLYRNESSNKPTRKRKRRRIAAAGETTQGHGHGYGYDYNHHDYPYDYPPEYPHPEYQYPETRETRETRAYDSNAGTDEDGRGAERAAEADTWPTATVIPPTRVRNISASGYITPEEDDDLLPLSRSNTLTMR